MLRTVLLGTTAMLLAACSASDKAADTAPTAADSAATSPAFTPSDADQTALRDAVTALFQPYKSDDFPSITERPIFTQATGALVQQWERSQTDQIDVLGDFDWLCQCNDNDPSQFALLEQTAEWTGPDSATVTVQTRGDPASQTRLIMAMRRESGKWLIEDLTFQGLETPLVAQLQREIAANTAAR